MKDDSSDMVAESIIGMKLHRLALSETGKILIRS